MLSSLQCLEPKTKLAIMRAFFLLRTRDEFTPLLNFLADLDSETTRNLRTLPLDQIAREQGKAQALADLLTLIDLAREAEIRRLQDQVNN